MMCPPEIETLFSGCAAIDLDDATAENGRTAAGLAVAEGDDAEDDRWREKARKELPAAAAAGSLKEEFAGAAAAEGWAAKTGADTGRGLRMEAAGEGEDCDGCRGTELSSI